MTNTVCDKMAMPRRTKIALVGTLLLGALSASPAARAPPANEWEIGPVIRGRNYSVGMPSTPPPRGAGWSFDLPVSAPAPGHVHAISYEPGPLIEKSRITLRYRVDAPRGTRFVPQEQPGMPGTVSLFLQRYGDNWSARGRYAHYRWYAPGRSVRQIAPGTYEMTVDLDDEWTNVSGRPASSHPVAFEDALADTGRIGLVFGSTSARGHGVYATAPARFTLLSFRID